MDSVTFVHLLHHGWLPTFAVGWRFSRTPAFPTLRCVVALVRYAFGVTTLPLYRCDPTFTLHHVCVTLPSHLLVAVTGPHLFDLRCRLPRGCYLCSVHTLVRYIRWTLPLIPRFGLRYVLRLLRCAVHLLPLVPATVDVYAVLPLIGSTVVIRFFSRLRSPCCCVRVRARSEKKKKTASIAMSACYAASLPAWTLPPPGLMAGGRILALPNLRKVRVPLGPEGTRGASERCRVKRGAAALAPGASEDDARHKFIACLHHTAYAAVLNLGLFFVYGHADDTHSARARAERARAPFNSCAHAGDHAPRAAHRTCPCARLLLPPRVTTAMGNAGPLVAWRNARAHARWHGRARVSQTRDLFYPLVAARAGRAAACAA